MSHCSIKKMSISVILFSVIIFIPYISAGEDNSLFSKEDILKVLKNYGEPDDLADSLSVNGVSIQQTKKNYNEIYDLYASFKESFQPVFITADVVFHTIHKVFNHSLRVIETGQLPVLKRFSEEMFNASVKLKQEWGKNEYLADSIDQLIAYFAVPNIIFKNRITIDDSLKEKAEAEIKLINEHNGFEFSKILSHKEDYSQYAVRGDYTRNENLKTCFLASMWYGRRMFRFDEAKPMGAGMPSDTPEIQGWWQSDDETLPPAAWSEIRSACLLVYLLQHTEIQDKSAMDIYKKLKKPIDIMVGISEDITVEKLSDVLEYTFKKDWKPDNLKDNKKLYAMAKELAKQNLTEIDTTGLGRKGLTLLGQRFIPDSKFLQRLVHDEENPITYMKKNSEKENPFTLVTDTTAGEVRGFPRGLDIMAILGSETAVEILTAAGDTDYVGYENNLSLLKKELEVLPLSGTIYEKILRYFALLFKEDKNAPEFMKKDIWKKKSLNTALGAWTELRHNTVLYGKESYTSMSRGGITSGLKAYAYLEPQPELYSKLDSILSDLKDSGIISDSEILKKYESLIKILKRFAEISQKELKGKLPDEKETDFLLQAVEKLKDEAELSKEISAIIGGESDLQMPIAVDVHTRIPTVLTEAVGFPAKIIVVIPVKGKPVLFFGGVYSYYEFKVPYEDRLTDEKWIKILKKKKNKYNPIFF